LTPEEAYETCKNKGERIPELEQIILNSNDSNIVYNYVCFIIKGPFPEGEEILATDTYWSVAYAINFLKVPFEKAHVKIFEKSEYNQIMINKYKDFLNNIKYDYSEWLI
jgi:hypothetical protein